jgi:hypothetical protein
MALNFPADITQPYVDTTSGLKYIYNDAVGAWESAIQPPVIITAAAPAIELDGFLWYDSTSAAVYIRFGDQWVLLTSAGSGGGGGGATNLVTISATPPTPAANGQLWWDNNSGRLFVYYIDPSTDAQWLDACPNIDGVNGGGAFSGPNAPSGAVEGDLWFNTTTDGLSVYVNGVWLPVQSQIEGIETLTPTEPIFLSGTTKDPIIAIRDATSAVRGSVKMASQAETNTPTLSNVALSPQTLDTILSTSPEVYIADATNGQKGIVELATDAETIAGSSSVTATTPAGVAAAITAAGSTVSIGSVIMIANGSVIPTGYLLCDGSAVDRSTYSGLFSNITTLYGAGNGSTTFNIPDMSGSITGLPYGAYCIKT